MTLSSPGSGLFFRYSKRPSLEGCGGTVHFAFDSGNGLLRGESVRRDHADEVAVADDFDARANFSAPVVSIDRESGVEAVGAK